MIATQEVRVIVGGNGTLGSTVANCLEKAGVNYTIVEAHDTVHARVGASIG